MSERSNTPFTNEHFAAYCLKMVGQPYWYGTCGYKATNDLLSRKAAQYPSHYASNRTSRYRQDIANKAVVCDCVGGVKGYMWTGGGQSMIEAIGTGKDVSNKYGSNGCPDQSANGMFTYAKSKGMPYGSISTIPDTVGLALYMDGHIGYTVGNGYAVEWRGFNYGCVKTKISGRGWKYWYKLPFINYNDSANSATGTTTITTTALGSRILRNGMTGSDVSAMQEYLIKLGYSCGSYGVDGDFGDATEMAVRAFQRDHGLEVDGEYGPKSHSAMLAALEKLDAAVNDARVVKIVGGQCWVRTAPNTTGAQLGVAKESTIWAYGGEQSEEGWLLIDYNGMNGWVSGKYGRLMS